MQLSDKEQRVLAEASQVEELRRHPGWQVVQRWLDWRKAYLTNRLVTGNFVDLAAVKAHQAALAEYSAMLRHLDELVKRRDRLLERKQAEQQQ